MKSFRFLIFALLCAVAHGAWAQSPAKTSDYASRFRLVFSAVSEDADDTESFAFFSNGQWFICNNDKATLQVIDVTGRVLSSETISGSVSKAIDVAPGVYILKLNDKVQKIVIE